MSGEKHGYVSYTHGCRCDVCKKSKADYMRAARARGREYAQRWTKPGDNARSPRPTGRTAFSVGAERAYVEGIKHGRHGYEVFGCRCAECTTARTESDRRVVAARRERRSRRIEAAS